jgi:hypothetical protein
MEIDNENHNHGFGPAYVRCGTGVRPEFRPTASERSGFYGRKAYRKRMGSLDDVA